MTALAITTDGRRRCIEQTIASLLAHVRPLGGPRFIFDDSGDDEYRDWLASAYDKFGFRVMADGPRVGQDRTIERAWRTLAVHEDERFVFWCEDDFTFKRDVDLTRWCEVLDTHPYLAQLALLRQPWFRSERDAGGIIQRDPEEYDFVVEELGSWIEHRKWFTLNPCLFRRKLCTCGWPTGRRHEWRFSRGLCEDPDVRFAYWGDGTPWVTHIGDERVGHGY